MSPTPPAALRARLSAMMFLQYAIWGAWLPLLYPFLVWRGFTSGQISAAFALGAVGAIIGPFIAGQIADRRFATEKFLALSHLAGAVLVWFLAGVAEPNAFLIISFLYGLIYAPTLALTNSLAFHHLTDRDKEFGPIRLWGTIGWIVVGIAMGQWLASAHSPAGASGAELEAAWNAGRSDAFKLSAVLCALMGAYCLSLPHTPPTRDAGKRNATLEALGEVRRQPLLTLFLLAVPISVIHQFYFVHTSGFLSAIQAGDAAAQGLAEKINRVFGVGGGGLMTIGQITEIGVLALIPLVAKRWSRKTLLALGIAAYAARMALFAYTTSLPAIMAGVALHGLCFGCFIFVAFMVVDEETTADVRASAQNLFNLVTIGLGIVVGSWFATSVVGEWAGGDYRKLFSIPMWMALACLLILLAAYPSRRKA